MVYDFEGQLLLCGWYPQLCHRCLCRFAVCGIEHRREERLHGELDGEIDGRVAQLMLANMDNEPDSRSGC